MKILVTGGAGFVGSHVVEALPAVADVVVLDDFSTGSRANLRDGVFSKTTLIEGSILDAEIPHDVDVVIHCAAHADISRNWDSAGERDRLWRTNVDGTRRMLEITPSLATFVLVSTLAVDADQASPYAASKVAGEQLVRAYADAGRLVGRIVRLPSCVGARYHHGHVADFARAAMIDRHVKTRDGGDVRKPFIHVRDAAREIAAEADNGVLWEEPRFTTKTVSAGYLWSCRDTLALMWATRARAFTLELGANARGWVGDPHDFGAHGTPVADAPRESVVQGVADALESLGWWAVEARRTA
jgi:UDP-glucose 4-epimerase